MLSSKRYARLESYFPLKHAFFFRPSPSCIRTYKTTKSEDLLGNTRRTLWHRKYRIGGDVYARGEQISPLDTEILIENRAHCSRTNRLRHSSFPAFALSHPWLSISR